MTQTELNTKIDELILHEIRLANVAATLHRQKDSAAFVREQEVMFLQNLIFALRGYILTDELMEDYELRTLIEMSMQVSLNWPRS